MDYHNLTGQEKMEGNKMWGINKAEQMPDPIKGKEKVSAIEGRDQKDEFGNYLEEQEDDDRETE